MTIIIQEKDSRTLFDETVSDFCKAVEAVTADRVIIGLPGGRSIVPFCESLLGRNLPAPFWRRLVIFLVDERVVPLNHPDSNYRTLNEVLFEPALRRKLLQPEQVVGFEPDFNRSDYGAGAYTARLGRYGGNFHIIILGAGEDGHVAALFPHHPVLSLTGPEFTWLADSPKPPALRMTAQRGLLETAETVFCLFLGAGKRDALKKFLDPRVSVAECPAKLINSIDRRFVATDQAADQLRSA